MKYIDLHVHSCFSDGTKTPSQLVELAKSQDLVAFALTDHDTMAGIPEAEKAAQDNGILLIPGIELSTKYKGTEIHILGYHLNSEDPTLKSSLTTIVERRENRNLAMCERLNAGGYPITYSALCEQFGDAIITRAHFAKYLFENGSVPSMDYAFHNCLNESSPYYVHREYLKSQEAVELIKEAGGIPVLAHPLLYHLSVSRLKELITFLIPYGLQGIEAMYSCNRGTDEAFVRKLGKDFNLICTGGSDYHGDNKPHIQLGRGMGNLFVPSEILDQLK